jgi:alpha-beta hydrolase superfamily lysophospholipase
MVSDVAIGKHENEICQLAGQTVHLDHFGATDARRHAIVIHGPWDHGEALWPIAQELASSGFRATLMHLPGCGRTPVEPGVDYANWIAPVVALCQRERPAHDKQLIAFGIGLGGTIAFHAAALGAPIDSLWLTAMGDPRRAALRQRILGSAWSPALTTLALQWLTPVIGARLWVPPGVLRRPVSLTVDVPRHSVRFLSSFLTYAPSIEPEAFRRCPVVLAAPTADPWLQLEPSLDFFRRLPGDKRLHMLEGAGHLPVDPSSAEALVRGLAQTTSV